MSTVQDRRTKRAGCLSLLQVYHPSNVNQSHTGGRMFGQISLQSHPQADV